MRKPGELLDLPAEQGARWLALRFLAEAEAAHRRLEAGADAEALHDFRVALRRLRSTLRAYDAHLEGSIGGKDRRRVRDLARATGESRDAEVHLEWLGKQLGKAVAAHRPGVEFLMERVRDEKDAADRDLRREVAKDFERERRRLAKRLSVIRVEVSLHDASARPTLAAVIGALAGEMAAGLREQLHRVGNVGDQERAHEARIGAKRLRYLLEPFAADLPGAGDVVKRIKKLQDLLGEMHDAHVLLAEVAAAQEDAGPPPAIAAAEQSAEDGRGNGGDRAGDGDPSADGDRSADGERVDGDGVRTRDGDQPADEDQPVVELISLGDGDQAVSADGDEAGDGGAAPVHPSLGLEWLAGRLVDERAARFRALERNWLGGAADDFFQHVDAVGKAATERGRGDVEIERKFLLRRMPQLEGEVEVLRIDQGWLPGEKLAERVRRVRSAAGTKWYRTVKLGSGISRVEVEEETTEPVFRRLWALTKGRRIHKVRYRVRDGALTWEIDRFSGLKLVVAEVELPTEDTRVAPPRWLSRWIVKEVTGDPQYVNLNLAR